MEERDEKLRQDKLLTIIWTLTGLSIAFVLVRCSVRLRLLKRLFFDDAFVVIVLLCNVALAVVVHSTITTLYQQEKVEYLGEAPPSDYHNIRDRFTTYQRAIAFLSFTSLWGVKASFLAFYSKITVRPGWLRAIWWTMVVVTSLSYVACFISYPLMHRNNDTSTSETKADAMSFAIYEFSVDVSTDILIMLVPLVLALNVSLPFDERISLFGVFSFSLIITVLSVVRFTLCNPKSGDVGTSWTTFFFVLHVNVALLIACLAGIRSLALDEQQPGLDHTFRNREPVSDQFLAIDQAQAFELGQKGKQQWSNTSWPPVEREAPYPRADSEDSMALELIDSRRSRAKSTVNTTETLSHPGFAFGTMDVPEHVRPSSTGRYR